MRITAAVCNSSDGQLSVEEVFLDEPGPHDVLVRVSAAGVCHTDYHYLVGDLQAPKPFVPGHEGAGVVEAVGSAVTHLSPGDSVCFMWRPRCGECPFCLTGRPALCQAAAIYATSGGLLDGRTRLHRADGAPLNHLLGVSCFAEYCVVSEKAAVAVAKDIPAEVAAITGCAVITGVGAVLNAVGRCAGDSIVIFGAGGVGLSAVIGAALAGAAHIAVVDVVEERLAAAAQLGATHLINATRVSVAEALRDIDPLGLHWAIEAVGAQETFGQAFDALRPGGTVVVVGLGAVGRTVSYPLNVLVQREKRIVGSLYGTANPPVDIPRLLDLYRAGRLPIDRLVGRRYPLADVSEAVASLQRDAVGRAVLLPGIEQ